MEWYRMESDWNGLISAGSIGKLVLPGAKAPNGEEFSGLYGTVSEPSLAEWIVMERAYQPVTSGLLGVTGCESIKWKGDERRGL